MSIQKQPSHSAKPRPSSAARRLPARLAVVASVSGLLAIIACGSPTKPDTTLPDDTHTQPDHVTQTQPVDTTPARPALAPPVYLPVAGDPIVSYAIWFQVGSQDDPPGKEGLAWLTGQLMAEGSTTQNTYEQIIARLYPMAASYEIYVDREMTTLRGRAHKDHVASFQQLLADAYSSPAFTPSDFERIRNRGLSYLEKTLRYASDEELGKAALYDFLFAGTGYRYPVTGTVAGLHAITLDDVKAFYKQHYTRDRAVFGLGGGYDSAASEGFIATRDRLPAGPAASKARPPEVAAFQGRHVVLVNKPGADASISMGFPIAVHRGEKDFYALWIATSWLGEHRNSSSHLYQVIRQARGLNYGDYAYIEAFPEGGFRQMPPTNVGRHQQMFEIWIRTLPNDKAVFALRAALRELRTLVDNGMTSEQFELTRSFLRKYIRHFAPSTQTRLGYAIDDRFYGIDDGHLARFVRMMDELTLDDVNQAIKKHLQYRDLKVAIVTGNADGLRQSLLGGAPTPIKYDVAKPDEIMRDDQSIAAEPLDIDASNLRVVPVDEMFAR